MRVTHTNITNCSHQTTSSVIHVAMAWIRITNKLIYKLSHARDRSCRCYVNSYGFAKERAVPFAYRSISSDTICILKWYGATSALILSKRFDIVCRENSVVRSPDVMRLHDAGQRCYLLSSCLHTANDSPRNVWMCYQGIVLRSWPQKLVRGPRCGAPPGA